MDNQYRDKLLIEVSKDVAVLTVCMQEIQKDLKFHMKRTSQNEVRIENSEDKLIDMIDLIDKRQVADSAFVKRQMYALKVLGFFFTGTAGLIGLLLRLGFLG